MDEEILGKAYDGRLMRRLVGYLRPYRKAVALSLLLVLIASFFQVIGPLLTKMAVDRYLQPAPSRVPTPFDPYLSKDPWVGLAQLSAIYLLVVLGSFVFEFSQSYLMQRTGQKAMFDLRCQLMAHLQRLDLAFYDRTPAGRLLTRVTTDVDALNELLASGLVTILGDLLSLGFVLVAMLQLSPSLTGLLLAVMPLVVGATIIFRRTATQAYRRIRVAIARINSYLQEHISGIVVLQLFNREKKSGEEFERANRQHMEAFKDAIVAYGWFFPVIEFLAMLALALLLAYGGFRISQGALTLGILIAFFQYGIRFFRPIQDLSEKYNLLQSAMAASERIFGLLDTPVAVTAPRSVRPFP